MSVSFQFGPRTGKNRFPVYQVFQDFQEGYAFFIVISGVYKRAVVLYLTQEAHRTISSLIAKQHFTADNQHEVSTLNLGIVYSEIFHYCLANYH